MKNIFKKDKDKGESLQPKDQPSRTRTSTNSPNLQASNSSRKDGDTTTPGGSPSMGTNGTGSIGRSSQATQQQQQQLQQALDAKKQHAIRIGDTRFYGRIICRAKALYDYPLDGDTLHVEDEEIKLLKFKKGDIINVYEQDTSGWWAGEFNDEKGIFPGSYMKVLEEEVPPEQPKHKSKSQTVPREELLNKISDLEAEREALINEHERDHAEFNKVIKDLKSKAELELLDLKRTLIERDEVIQASAKKIRSTEKELEEVAAKLAAKEVEVLTLELEIQESKNKLPDASAKQELKRLQDDRNSKSMQADIQARNVELQELNKQKLEVDKGIREAKQRLAALEAQILKKVMSSPISDSGTFEREEDIDMLKKQLGEEVFEKRRMENEIREMKRMCVDVENLKTDKARLEAEVASKTELENKLNKIDTILQSLINKDASTLTVASIKDLLTKVRKGIASSPNGLKSGSSILGLSSSTGATPSNSRPPSPTRGGDGKGSIRPKTGTFYKDT